MSHRGYGLHALVGMPPAYITFMRKPIDQVVSNYHHLLEKGFNDFSVPAGSDPFDYFIQSQHADNLQAQYISGLPYKTFREMPPQEVLQFAKDNIERHFLFVGFMERFQESLCCIAGILGWKILFSPRSNRQEGSYTLTEKAKEIIGERNRIDSALYDWAFSRFSNELDRGLESITEKTFQNPDFSLLLNSVRLKVLEICDRIMK